MKLTLKEKAKLFWDRNKGMILGLMAMAGAATAIGAVGAHYSAKAEKKRQKELEEAWKAYLEEAQKKEEMTMNNLANQLTGGGYVDPNNDNLYEADCPNILANCVPLSSMGQFGQDIIDRYKATWPNWDEVGMFNPETAVADVIMDFGHEKWLEAQRAKEAESQEKQSA